jgi:hypothetical protein
MMEMHFFLVGHVRLPHRHMGDLLHGAREAISHYRPFTSDEPYVLADRQ